MTVDTIIATMNRKDFSFLEKMNLEGSVVVINQCDRWKDEKIVKDSFHAQVFSCDKRGLSNSRNEGVLKSNADVFLTGDDDIVYRPGYNRLVASLFEEHPKIDIIAFNINRINTPEGMIVRKQHTVWKKANNNKYYPSVSLAYRKSSFEKANLHFHPLFGAGAKYLSGEESLVLLQSRKAGLVVYECPEVLADVDCSSSTWFKGYDEKYFFDKGAFLKYAYPRTCALLKYYFLTKRKSSKMSTREILKQLNKGIKSITAGEICVK